MKKIFMLVAAISVVVGFIYARGMGACFVPVPLSRDGNISGYVPGYYETKEMTFNKNSCKAGYRKLKRIMRREAAHLCKTQYGSPAINPLGCLDYRKIS